jgi:hypothetical protein
VSGANLARGAGHGDGARPRRQMDPQGRQALFGAAPVLPADRIDAGAPEGRHALYSAGPRRRGTAVVECSDCGSRTRLTLADLGLRLLAGSLWVPGRRHSRWMRCPACHDATWCRIRWTG